MSSSLQPHGLQHARPPCPLSSPRLCQNSCSLYWWCCPAISDTLVSFYPRSFPASGTFPMSCLFRSEDQNTRVSALASVLTVNIQGWSLLRLTVLISLLSIGLSEVFSSTTVRRHQFFDVLSSLWSNSHNHTRPLGRPTFLNNFTIFYFFKLNAIFQFCNISNFVNKTLYCCTLQAFHADFHFLFCLYNFFI